MLRRDGWTYRPTDTASSRVACTQLKIVLARIRPFPWTLGVSGEPFFWRCYLWWYNYHLVISFSLKDWNTTSTYFSFWGWHVVARYICLLSPLMLTCSSALCFPTLASLACSIHGLAHSLRSLPCGTTRFTETIEIFVISIETRPIHKAQQPILLPNIN